MIVRRNIGLWVAAVIVGLSIVLVALTWTDANSEEAGRYVATLVAPGATPVPPRGSNGDEPAGCVLGVETFSAASHRMSEVELRTAALSSHLSRVVARATYAQWRAEESVAPVLPRRHGMDSTPRDGAPPGTQFEIPEVAARLVHESTGWIVSTGSLTCDATDGHGPIVTPNEEFCDGAGFAEIY